jgi:hypothetical protein
VFLPVFKPKTAKNNVIKILFYNIFSKKKEKKRKIFILIKKINKYEDPQNIC